MAREDLITSHHSIMLAGQTLDPLLLPAIQILMCEFLEISSASHSTSPRCDHSVTERRIATHIVLLLQVNPLFLLAQKAQFLFLGQLPHLAIVSLVAERCCRRQEEAAQHHGRDEGQSEKCERVAGEESTIAGGGGAVVGAAAEGFAREDGHG